MTDFTDMVHSSSKTVQHAVPAHRETRSWRRHRRNRKLAALAAFTA